MDDFGSLIYWILTIGFVVFGALSSNNKKKQSKKNKPGFFGDLKTNENSQTEPKLSDMFDFMNDVNDSDYIESERPLEVFSKPEELKSNVKKNINICNKTNKDIEKNKNVFLESNDTIEENYFSNDIDWRSAIMHSEIINRKYF